MSLTHHCRECGAQVDADGHCPAHPSAIVETVSMPPTLAPDVASALASALQAIAEEKETHALALDNLRDVTTEAAQQFGAGNVAGSHFSIGRALDLAFELLGECDAIEPLAAVLGYEDPAPGVLS